MSSADISEEVLRDHLRHIEDVVGGDGRVDVETLQRLAKMADDLGKDARRLRWERAKRRKQ